MADETRRKPNGSAAPGPSAGRSRPQEAADEVHRELIADAVCAVIASEGMEAATLRRVAAELDSTTGLISHYFSAKNEMLIYALQHATRQILGTSPRQRPTSLEDYLRAYCQALPLDPIRNQYWRVYAAFRTTALSDSTLQRFLAEYGEEQAKVYRSMLATAVVREIDDPVVDRLQRAMEALLDGFGMAATERPELLNPNEVFDLLKLAIDAWTARATQRDGAGMKNATKGPLANPVPR